MRPDFHRCFGAAVAAAALLGTFACSTASGPRRLPPPPSEPLRTELGAAPLGVAAGHVVPALEYSGGARGAGEGAMRGAAQGALAGALPGAAVVSGAGGNAFAAFGGFMLAVAGAVVGTPVGAVVGAIAAEPAAKVEARDTAFKTSVADIPVQRALREHVVTALRRETRQELVALDASGPRGPDERTAYDDVGREGVPMVLETSVERVALEGPRTIDPSLRLVMSVRTRLVRALDGSVLYESHLTWSGWSRKPDDWSREPLVRQELDRACANLAEKIVDEVFLLYVLAPQPRR